ncbi:lysine N(6)-hydroxylase/L-ornithine N(5)-oxygenase family protein [Streptomyces lasiicapitis]|uniref:L-lysine N6-monooxygenase MbtG n=1 Tax=Streptomyces lasiicapitis TaxID=1923961 RepID=A0ABQ2LJM1_9ACTN|nr:lysine N(6)-hydroxylase/L-ornithine N(5)-oxygenase family protein [Streptomyces lasiicapitis]GGO37415.1 lysine/ornithine N-monooxygenase [Streptomyces lasiicapitis]
MGTREHEIYDIVGIGFGPSNLSLAIALEEHEANTSERPVRAAFFERQPRFGWHRNMLLPQATMQISFLKDLATFRNPLSRFSFVSYLHESNRLAQFVNNQDFFPTRQEFHQYLEWAEAGVRDRVTYNSEVTEVRLVEAADGVEQHLVIVVKDTVSGAAREVKARNITVSTGLVPRMPDGMERDERVWHSSEFLAKYGQMNPEDLKNVAVVGAGQSAAEITKYLHDMLPQAQVSAILPSYGYSVADDTPFANQVFDADAVDHYYFGTEKTRDAFWRYHKNTNYSVVDDDVIRELFRRSYEEEVAGEQRLHFLNLTRVKEVKRSGSDTRVVLHSLLDGESEQEMDVDALVFATGYSTLDATSLLGDLDKFCQRDEEGRHRVERDYRVVTSGELSCGIYLQGGTEHTHGLTSSLLSNIAVRSGEIVDSIVERRGAGEKV